MLPKRWMMVELLLAVQMVADVVEQYATLLLRCVRVLDEHGDRHARHAPLTEHVFAFT